MKNESPSFFRSKVAKGIYVGIFTLAMGIPLIFVSSLVKERQQRKSEVEKEVTNQWSNAQEIKSVFITIPFTENIQKESIVNGKKITTIEKVESRIYISPKSMNVVGKVDPEIRKLGIYEVVVYNSLFSISGEFEKIDLPNKSTRIYDEMKAQIIFGVEDIRGLQEELIVSFGEQKVSLENSDINGFLAQNVTLPTANTPYSFKLNIRGSKNLTFVPTAANTKIEINSKWSSPGFYGAFLPSHDIRKNGFKAEWAVLELNRNLSRVFYDLNNSSWQEYSFGVNLVETANNYHKNERAAKYGLLIIALTFLAFFFVEVLTDQKVNMIQYGLIGLALIIFYCLLLSISEYLLFNYAYLISSAMTVILIFLFSKSLLGSLKPALAVSGLIAILYTFIFTIIQLDDTALLIGSLGLFIILAFTMWISRKVKWES
ncbi:inner membrane protein [Spirosomataceae bacterium TFI 002]|nr:inner membrane protein [Spirosomataceae bacterium TFI 002]